MSSPATASTAPAPASPAPTTPASGSSGSSGSSPPLHHNLIEGPITKTLLLFSLPMMGVNVLQSLNGTANQFWVSHSLGVNAITAIGNANVIMFLIQALILGVTMAANIMVAQAVGAKDPPMVKRIMGTATGFFLVLSVSLALLGSLVAPGVLRAMNTPPAAQADAIVYLRIIFASMPFSYFFMFIQMAQRGAGDSRTPLYFMGLAVVLDVILNPLLIRGLGPFPKMAIAGSATSTLIGQGVSFLLLAVHLYRKRSILVLWPSELGLLKPDMHILRPLVMRGLPMGGNMLVMSSAALVMIGFVNHYGAVTAAAYTGASLVWSYIQMPGMALGAAVSSMAAQNVGAGRWDRVDLIARSGIISNLIVSGSIAALIYALGPLPLHLFLPAGSATIAAALEINRIVLWSFVLFNTSFILSGVVRSTGAVKWPLIILIISMWIVRVPFAWLLTPWIGQAAIWWSFPLGTIMSCVLSLLYYRFGGWREQRMLSGGFGREAAGRSAPMLDPLEESAAI